MNEKNFATVLRKNTYSSTGSKDIYIFYLFFKVAFEHCPLFGK